MMRVLVSFLVALLILGCSGDQPNTIHIIGIERPGERALPALTLLSDREAIALQIRIRRGDASEIVDRASRIELILFRCGQDKRFYTAELYGDGLPLGRDWRFDTPDNAASQPRTFSQVATLVAFVPRPVIDVWGYDCARFMERGRQFLVLDSVNIISNAVRVPRARVAAAISPS